MTLLLSVGYLRNTLDLYKYLIIFLTNNPYIFRHNLAQEMQMSYFPRNTLGRIPQIFNTLLKFIRKPAFYPTYSSDTVLNNNNQFFLRSANTAVYQASKTALLLPRALLSKTGVFNKLLIVRDPFNYHVFVIRLNGRGSLLVVYIAKLLGELFFRRTWQIIKTFWRLH